MMRLTGLPPVRRLRLTPLQRQPRRVRPNVLLLFGAWQRCSKPDGEAAAGVRANGSSTPLMSCSRATGSRPSASTRSSPARASRARRSTGTSRPSRTSCSRSSSAGNRYGPDAGSRERSRSALSDPAVAAAGGVRRVRRVVPAHGLRGLLVHQRDARASGPGRPGAPGQRVVPGRDPRIPRGTRPRGRHRRRPGLRPRVAHPHEGIDRRRGRRRPEMRPGGRSGSARCCSRTPRPTHGSGAWNQASRRPQRLCAWRRTWISTRAPGPPTTRAASARAPRARARRVCGRRRDA